jgi:hypothetical protein
MKLIALFFLLTSFSAFANNDQTLLSANTCMRAMIVCPQVVGVDFVTDQDGRCGCVKEENYYAADFCIRAYITCEEKKGYTFSSLMKGGKMIGCGCFKTAKDN